MAMPIYIYECQECKSETEELQKFSDPPLEKCPKCGKLALKRKMGASSFHLKGGGWASDGYSG
jgi:putative FmdB family regulatory protein